MAGLNLVPNPTLIAVQAGIFFTSLYVVKKLFLEPYTDLRERRLNATVGNKDGAADLLRRNEENQQVINQKMALALNKAREIMAASLQKATDERQVLVAAADKEAKHTLETMHTALKKDLDSEKEKIPSSVQAISNVVFAKLLQ